MPSKEGREAYWKSKLTPEQYRVMREKETEMPFSGKYVAVTQDGTYRCAACRAQLFDSNTKFDSGTGWPSFTETLPGAVRLERDTSHALERTEVLCSACGSHLGHLFDDGPREQGGKRFCINSCSLDLEETQ